MKTIFYILVVLFLNIDIYSQDFILKWKDIEVDSIISIDGESFSKYVVKNIRYPIDAQENERIGTFLGCLRLDEKGNLIDVFIINSISKSIDNEFESLMLRTWKNNDVVTKNLDDTTDIVFPISFKLAKGPNSHTFGFHVDKQIAPVFIKESITMVGYPYPPSDLNLKSDQSLIEIANNKYKAEKYKKCLTAVNELIRRNPYNPDIFFMRAMIYLNLEKDDLACRDYYYLKNFLKSEKYKKPKSCE